MDTLFGCIGATLGGIVGVSGAVHGDLKLTGMALIGLGMLGLLKLSDRLENQ